jgi:uncharacterized protein (TIGR00255 family)
MNSRFEQVRSMTGFGAASQEHALGRLSVELRAVNSRFLDLHFRLPEELRVLEPMLREALTTQLQRGKVEVRAHWVRQQDQPSRLVLKDPVLESLFEAQRAILRRFPAAAPLTVADCLNFPGVIDAPHADAAEWIGAFTPVALTAVRELKASRAREGQKLATAILAQSQAIRALLAQIKPRIPQLTAELTRRIGERLQEATRIGLQGAAIPQEEVMARIRQEVALHGLRTDVAEELDRLGIHLDELQRVLDAGGVIGKRLDFLLQEFNREANTLGSKTLGLDLGQIVVELKLLIEQMREQVQNIE